MAAVGNRPLADRLFQVALNLSDAREGALFVVMRDAEDAAQMVAAAERLDVSAAGDGGEDVFPTRSARAARASHGD